MKANIGKRKDITLKAWSFAGFVLAAVSIGLTTPLSVHAATTDTTENSSIEVDAASGASSSASANSVNSSSAVAQPAVSNSASASEVSGVAANSSSVAGSTSSVASSQSDTTTVDNSAVATTNSAASDAKQVKTDSATIIPTTGYSADSSGDAVYYSNGELANGYINDGNNWYLFKDGVKQSDVQAWAGTYYYFDHTTYLRSDNVYAKSNWGDYYLFGNDGRIATDVQAWAGTYYYFDHSTYLRVDNNYAKSNWGDYYLFGNDGKIATDVQAWAGTYYYFDHHTYLRVDNKYVRSNWGDWYMFGANGRIVSGFANWLNRTYYFNASTYLKVINSYVKNGNNTYWLDDTGVMRTQTWQIEKAIEVGMALVGKSPYDWGGGRTSASIANKSFDCSSFIHYIFAAVGINLGNYTSATTYTEIKLGTAVSWSDMKRGDIFFMDNCGHVGIYLGNGLFLHDSPNSSTGGVGINSLSDMNKEMGKTWAQIADGSVRRII
ncbi:NLP/P60 protein [Paucilactobacillus hokkaidonensis JCM 18461]|uniref:NLP/P60 protein n=2 Tax=Paucilactobacillus hokkaidonensis TaxID=1193095 RepID=A0A0A1GXM8_9LACO|nr:C40 family peptidase [Paucilactobacillus hokkaidonensis]KRO09560.1 NLP P60 protein [Paucilactobacillus hokkaidonensis]BAP85216.1 NLP/P60 protein [Paucilactobacillus hokkaidonensis JCM 18461]